MMGCMASLGHEHLADCHGSATNTPWERRFAAAWEHKVCLPGPVARMGQVHRPSSLAWVRVDAGRVDPSLNPSYNTC